MENMNGDTRIPLWIESSRGDDRLGTAPDGKVVSDFEAEEKGIPFEPDVPKEKIQEAVEAQLKDDKWVHIEKSDGSSELLTKKDLQKAKQFTFGTEGEIVAPPTPAAAAPPVKEPEKVLEKESKPASCKAGPKEVWESKFENITSAMATHKGKGG